MKKKYLFLSLVAIAAMMTGCSSNDDIAQAPEGKMMNIPAITVNVTEPATRAGYTSEVGAWTNYWNNNNNAQANFDYRVIVQVFAKGNLTTPVAEVRKPIATTVGDAAPEDNQISIENLRLPAGNSYEAVAWVDFVAKGKGDVNTFYDTKNLASVSIAEKDVTDPVNLGNIYAEMKDCYTGAIEFTLTSDGAITNQDGNTLNITARRPLAKVRVVLTDYSSVKEWNAYFAGQDAKRVLNAAAMKVANMSNAFNAVTGLPVASTNTYTYYSTYNYGMVFQGDNEATIRWIKATGTKANNDLVATSITDELPAEGVGYYPVLDFNYFIPASNEDAAVYNMSFEALSKGTGDFAWGDAVTAETETLTEADWRVLSIRNISSVPVKKNCLTTIWGNMLTKNYNFLVTVDDSFDSQARVIVNDDGSTVSTFLVGDDQAKIVVYRDADNNITSIDVDKNEDKLNAKNYADVMKQLNNVAGTWTKDTKINIYPNTYLPETQTDGVITDENKLGTISFIMEDVLAGPFALSGVHNPLAFNTGNNIQTKDISVTSTNNLVALSGATGSFKNIALKTTGEKKNAVLAANTEGKVDLDAAKVTITPAVNAEGTALTTTHNNGPVNINQNTTAGVGLINGATADNVFNVNINSYSDLVLNGGSMNQTVVVGTANKMYSVIMQTAKTQIDAYVDNFGALNTTSTLYSSTDRPSLYKTNDSAYSGLVGDQAFYIYNALTNAKYDSSADLNTPD
jgi:hypothetical protein